MEYICSGAAVETYTKYTPLLREPIPACSTADANQKNRLFYVLFTGIKAWRSFPGSLPKNKNDFSPKLSAIRAGREKPKEFRATVTHRTRPS